MPTIEEDEKALHDAATARAGLSDFGEQSYRTGMRVMLEAMHDDPDNEPLRNAVFHHATDALVGRLHAQVGWNAHPECLKLQLRAPLIITGMPRTGTSMLHQLLSNDEQFQWMPNWVAAAPRVRPPRDEWERDPAYIAAARALDALFSANPKMRAAHNNEAALPEECIRVMIQSFTTMRYVSTLPMPRYEQWFIEQDETPSYRRFADNLRLMGLLTPDKPWLLKNPSHAIGIESLLKVFPDAMVVTTHRNPFESIASGAGTILASAAKVWRDKNQIGKHRLRVWARAAHRLERARRAQPDRFIEIAYDDLMAAPFDQAEKIYARFGLTLTDPVRAAMRQWLIDNPRGKHGKHEYSLENVGLTRDDIATTLADYNSRYGYDHAKV